jgi:maltooligosyltrehalose trehalohydrolase
MNRSSRDGTIDPVLEDPMAAPAPGAVLVGDGRCRFIVWAPEHRRVEVVFGGGDRRVELEAGERGYHLAIVEDVAPGARYRYRLEDGRELPDPASRSQPEGVHGPSEVIDPTYPWTVDEWANPPLAEHVFYEIHVGAFSAEGTFAGVAARLDDLVELGVTALELMPVAPFSGDRGWGYDGVYPWAVHQAYGGLRGLQRLVDEAHRRDLAVFLDVVHNHLGPEGNHLGAYAPYFTDRYRTPWGAAVNFDGPGADEVRRFFVGSALHLIDAARVDGLRLDAVHAIYDRTAIPFVEELTAHVHAAAAGAGRRVHVVAENNTNDPRLVRPRERGGCGLDGQWSDDFHHALVALLSGERAGYYGSYGERSQLERALRDGWVYAGQYSPYRGRRHGRPPQGVEPGQLVVYCQNHDQVGNRLAGERLGRRVGFAAAKLAAAMVLLSPFVPLLFMGEEYDESAPFLYFTSHRDPALGRAVREGRRREFTAFGWDSLPPDPQAAETFTASRLDWTLRRHGRHAQMLRWYRELLRLRREHPALGASGAAPAANPRRGFELELPAAGGPLVLRRSHGNAEALMVANLDREPCSLPAPADATWRRVLDSEDVRFGGDGESSQHLGAHGVAVYSR